MAEAAANLTKAADGDSLHSWSRWSDRSRRQTAELQVRAKAAEADLATCMGRLVLANQNAKLLEKLKAEEFAKWQSESDKETEAFAGETFLRQVTIKKRMGA